MIPAYIFDIDGTLSDPKHRLHYIEGEQKDWGAFFGECDQDAPIPHMIDLATDIIIGTDAVVLFCTGRSDDVKAKTVAWLQEQFPDFEIGPEDVYMRAAGDHRDDVVVKSELMDRIIADGCKPVMVFEDRARVVEMWRQRGIPCLQVQAGNY
jgi:phosphoglycolate phosphatase-like HAD superfamily hydrolase